MATLRSFEAPHKGLRNVISKFSLCLGYTDLRDSSELSYLKALGHEMFTLLNDHVHTENEHTLRYLEERVKGASQHDREDHERLEEVQSLLEKRLSELTRNEPEEGAHQFYLEFSRFQSQYLEHIYEEETITERLLQENFTNDELIAHRMEIMKTVKFPIMLLWMKYTIPAMRNAEARGMLAGLKTTVPAEAFLAVLTAIKGEMPPERYQQLISTLS